MKQIGLILAGCGVYDGSEIHEAVLTLLALDRAGAAARCFAPDIGQHHVVNHRTGEIMAGESRNVLTESARIARGTVSDLRDIDMSALDGLIIPGGFGAAKNLCDYAFNGTLCEVQPDVARVVRAFHESGKPVGFLCIAPVIAARLFGPEGVEVTIGNDGNTASHIAAMGARHVAAAVDEIHVDRAKKIVTTPAYMLGPSIAAVEKGIVKLVDEVLALC